MYISSQGLPVADSANMEQLEIQVLSRNSGLEGKPGVCVCMCVVSPLSPDIRIASLAAGLKITNSMEKKKGFNLM